MGRIALPSTDHPLAGEYLETDLLVSVTPSEIFKNCPRYIHRYQRQETSPHVPQASVETPLPDWKKLDLIQDFLPPRDHGKAAQQGGTLTAEELDELERRED